MSDGRWAPEFIIFTYFGIPLMISLESAPLVLTTLHLIIVFLFASFIIKECGWFKTYPTPHDASEWAILQSGAAATVSFWLGTIAILVALLALDDIKSDPFPKGILIALTINVLISGIPALVPLGSNLLIEIKGTKKLSMVKPLALSWLLLAVCLMEMALGLLFVFLR